MRHAISGIALALLFLAVPPALAGHHEASARCPWTQPAGAR